MFTVEFSPHFRGRHWIIFEKLIPKIIPPKWTIYEDFKGWICSLDEQICTVKSSDRSQMSPKKYSTILHSQFNYHKLPVTPFKEILIWCTNSDRNFVHFFKCYWSEPHKLQKERTGHLRGNQNYLQELQREWTDLPTPM